MEDYDFKEGDKVMLRLNPQKVFIFIEKISDSKAKCINSDNKPEELYLATIEPYKFTSFFWLLSIMDWNLIGTILSSSIVAAFLTKALDQYSANVTYKRDYYKKVIEERLRVYTQLNGVLYQITGNLVSVDGCVYNAVFKDANAIIQFFNELNKVNAARMWMSEDLEVLLKTFIETIGAIFYENNIAESTPSIVTKNAGIKVHKEFTYFRQSLEHQLTIDLSCLHDVPAFFKKQILHAKPDMIV